VTSDEPHEITKLLLDWSNGDRAALERLTPLVYEELRRQARRYMVRERHGHTLQTTALAHEAYLRLIDQRRVQWQNRAHFFAIAAQLMRRILVDYARGRRYAKRGGEAKKMSLEAVRAVPQEVTADLVALDDALKSLAEVDSRRSQVIELRFFGGLSVKETAEVLNVSVDTVRRDWNLARAWLHREMRHQT
jgi:RNA polymerase sigma-70 factor, ECF subfamily